VSALAPTGLVFVTISLIGQIIGSEGGASKPSLTHARDDLRAENAIPFSAYGVHGANWVLAALPWAGVSLLLYLATPLSVVIFSAFFLFPFLACAWYFLRSWLTSPSQDGTVRIWLNDGIVVASALLISLLTNLGT
jgi:hypothetical protein